MFYSHRRPELTCKVVLLTRRMCWVGWQCWCMRVCGQMWSWRCVRWTRRVGTRAKEGTSCRRPSAIWVIVISLIWPPPSASLDNYVIMVPPVAVRYDIVTGGCAGVEFTTSSLAGSRARPPRTDPGHRPVVMSYKHCGLWCVHVDPHRNVTVLSVRTAHSCHSFVVDYKCSLRKMRCFVQRPSIPSTTLITYICYNKIMLLLDHVHIQILRHDRIICKTVQQVSFV